MRISNGSDPKTHGSFAMRHVGYTSQYDPWRIESVAASRLLAT
jgi:hypothetical protein